MAWFKKGNYLYEKELDQVKIADLEFMEMVDVNIDYYFLNLSKYQMASIIINDSHFLGFINGSVIFLLTDDVIDGFFNVIDEVKDVTKDS